MLGLKVPDACPSELWDFRKHNLPSGELSAQGQVSVPPSVHTGQGPGTPGVTFSQVGCMTNGAGHRLDKPSGPGGTWEAWRAKDSKDAPGPRSRPWDGQETAGAATSSQRERGRGYVWASWPPLARNTASLPLRSLLSPLSSGGPTLRPLHDPGGQMAVPTSPSFTPCRP